MMDDDDFTPLPTQVPSTAADDDFTPIQHQFSGSQELSANDKPLWSGSFLPVSQYPGQSPQWDWNTGIAGGVRNLVGAAGNAFNIPGEVATGKIQVGGPGFAGRVADAASLVVGSPMGIADRAAPLGATALRNVANSQYKALRNLDVNYTVPGVSNFANTAMQNLFNKNYSSVHDDLGKTSFDILSQLANPDVPPGWQATHVPLAQVENARSMLTGLATKPGKAGQAAREARSMVDDFMENPDPNNVLSGDADQAAALAKQARGNWAAYERSSTLTNKEAKAEMQQRPTADALRGYLRTLMDPEHPERVAQFNPQERQAISNFIDPSTTQKTLGTIGRTFVGSGNEIKPAWMLAGEMLGSGAGLAGGQGGPESAGIGAAASLAPYIAGLTANSVRNRLASRQFGNIDELVRSRAPASQSVMARPGGINPWEKNVGLGIIKGGSPSQGLGDLRAVERPPTLPAYPGAPVSQLID